MLIYIDSSVLGRALLPDEAGSEDAAALLQGDEPMFTSTLTRIEVAGLLARAQRAGRTRGLRRGLSLLDDLVGEQGTITEVRPPDPAAWETEARDIVVTHRLRALDALHLAAAAILGPDLAGTEKLGFASRDHDQAIAARKLGLAAR